MKFCTGTVTITENCKETFKANLKLIDECLHKHSNCDFGIASEGTTINNNDNLPNKGMILSVYRVKNKVIWIQTHKGHMKTTILLPTDL